MRLAQVQQIDIWSLFIDGAFDSDAASEIWPFERRAFFAWLKQKLEDHAAGIYLRFEIGSRGGLLMEYTNGHPKADEAEATFRRLNPERGFKNRHDVREAVGEAFGQQWGQYMVERIDDLNDGTHMLAPDPNIE